MEQLTLFDLNEGEAEKETVLVKFTDQQEDELTRAMAQAIIAAAGKEWCTHEQRTGA